MGVPFFYGMVEFSVIGIYCIAAWKAGWTKAPPTEPFWKVVTVNYEVLLAEKLAQEGSNVEVQLGGDGYKNESPSSDVGACLYYCHEPDLSMVDPPASDNGKSEQLVAKDDNAAMKMWANARSTFWKSLGYDVQE